MRILFDKNVAVPLRRFLIGHEVDGAARRGWDRLKNGELLQRAEDEGFDILITGDKDDYMVYERTTQRRKIALIVLGAGNWPNVQVRYENCRRSERREAGDVHIYRNASDAEAAL